MIKDRHTAEGYLLTAVILEIFRLNGRLLEAGNGLTADLGLSSARWQILGGLDARPQTVSGVARLMGLSRQSAQRTINRLAQDGFIVLRENPDHKRAKLAELTREGRGVLEHLKRAQATWVNALAEGLDEQELEQALAVLRQTRGKLETDKED